MRSQFRWQLVQWDAMFRVSAEDLWRLVRKRRRRYWGQPEAGVHLIHRRCGVPSPSAVFVQVSDRPKCDMLDDADRILVVEVRLNVGVESALVRSGTKVPTCWGFGVPLTINSPPCCS